MDIDGYTDLDFVGSGGNAHVYRAKNEDTGTDVAIKILRGSGSEEVLRRFERERQSMAKLEHIDHVVPILDSGTTEGRDPYLVMPMLTGGSLDQILRTRRFDHEEALTITRSIATAVAEAHELDVLHLDIKPANVLLDDDGKPWLADFGISEFMGTTASLSGSLVTPAYAPPERLNGAKPSEQSDIYALGALLFSLVTGSVPFSSAQRRTSVDVMVAVVNEPVEVDRIPEDAPESVTNLVLRTMSKDVEHRPDNTADLIELIDDALEGRPISPPPEESRGHSGSSPAGIENETIVPTTIPGMAPAGAATSGSTLQRLTSGRWSSLAFISLFVVGVLAATFVVTRDDGAQAVEADGVGDEPAALGPAEFIGAIEIGDSGETFVRYRFTSDQTTDFTGIVLLDDEVVAVNEGTATANGIVTVRADGLVAGTDYLIRVTLDGEPPTTATAEIRTPGGNPNAATEDVAILDLRVTEIQPTRVQLNYETNICANGSFVIVRADGEEVGRNDGLPEGCGTNHLAIPGLWTANLDPNTTYTVTVMVEANGSGLGNGNIQTEDITFTTSS